MKRVYLAGWDVFRPDAKEYGERLKVLCSEYGFEGLYPLDNEFSDPKDIYRGNIDLIKKADFIIANVNPFRGFEPDSGTAFEIGYGAALNKTVIAYTSRQTPMKEWVKDENGFSVEDFGFPVNLMLAFGARIVVGTARDALKLLCELP